MKRIKINFPLKSNQQLLFRQTPHQSGIWGDCHFIFDEEDPGPFDYWFIFHRTSLLRPVQACCDRDKVFFVSMEPRDLIETTVYNYPKFYRQFARVITSDNTLRHPYVVLKNIHSWWVGLSVSAVSGIHEIEGDQRLNYEVLQQPLTVKKINRIAIITSRNTFLPGHVQRSAFIDFLLQSELAPLIDVFGFDRNPINDKYEVLKYYNYHLVLENSTIDHYWTEKLADAFLSECYPLYWGCPNIYDYFTENSLLSFDIYEPESAVVQIKKALKEQYHIQYAKDLMDAKYRVLNDYNLFNELQKICVTYSSKPKKIKIYPPQRTLKRLIMDVVYRVYAILGKKWLISS